MNNQPSFYRARFEAFAKAISYELSLPESREGRMRIAYLRNGIEPTKFLLKESYEFDIGSGLFRSIYAYIKEFEKNDNKPLTELEIHTLDTFFVLHPEKVCGVQTCATGYSFPIKTIGSIEDVKNAIDKTLNGGEKTNPLPDTSKTIEVEKTEILNSQLETYKQKVLNLEKEKESLLAQRQDIFKQEKATDDFKFSRELFEKKNAISQKISQLDIEILHANNVLSAYANGGEITDIVDKNDLLNASIPSFIKVNTSVINFDVETILTDERPKYIPLINEDTFRRKGYVFDAIRIDKDTYIVACNGYSEFATEYNKFEKVESKKHPTVSQQGYVLLTLDQLVLTNDYYFTKAKATLQKEASDKNKRNEAYYDQLSVSKREQFLNQKNYYNVLPASVKKKVTQAEYEALDLEGKEALYKPYKRSGAKKLVSLLENDSMWVSFHNMYERFIDPTAVQPKKGYANSIVFAYWANFRDMMQFKIKDIKMQREVENEIYVKAVETSFGDSNTVNNLFDKYGILVKRQDGKNIQPLQIDQIEGSWIAIQNLFGNISRLAKKSGLKISHTNQTNVFASKAIGVYIPKMSTIAVSSKYGDEQFKSTFAHEIAHFIDNKFGEQKGKRFITDDYESTAGVLAFTFRKLLNKKTNSDYLNATKECFARAMEQYFAISFFGDGAELAFSNSPLNKVTKYFTEDNYVSKESFYGTIKPLAEKFLAELDYSVFGDDLVSVKNKPAESAYSSFDEQTVDQIIENIKDEIFANWQGNDVRERMTKNSIWREINKMDLRLPENKTKLLEVVYNKMYGKVPEPVQQAPNKLLIYKYKAKAIALKLKLQND